jgi:DNA-binding NarL/FixJ family response regulator
VSKALIPRVLAMDLGPTSQKTRVMIADDHPVTREGLCSMLARDNMDVVAQAADGREAVRLFSLHQPQLTLMDLHMPGKNGLEALSEIRQSNPDALIMVLTCYAGDIRVTRALAAGARSYILKTSDPQEMRVSIRRVLNGEVVQPPDLARAGPCSDCLTPREVSVVKLIAQGIPNRDIGKSLNVSEHTIKARIKSILGKLRANDRSHAVTVARDLGYLDL